MMAAQKGKQAKDGFTQDPDAETNASGGVVQGQGKQDEMSWGDWMAIAQAAKQMNQDTTATIEGENMADVKSAAGIKGQFIQDYANSKAGGGKYPLYMLRQAMEKKPEEDEFFLDKFHGHKLLGKGLGAISKPAAKRWDKAHQQ